MALTYKTLWNDLFGEYNVGLFQITQSGHLVDIQAVSIVDSSGNSVVSSSGMLVDTELSAATLLADGDAIPTAGKVGAVMMGKNTSGTLDIGKLSKAHDVDSGAGTEYATGISIRKAASGGSVAMFETNTNAGFTKLTDGTNDGSLNSVPTFAAGLDVTSLKALLTQAVFGFKWDSGYSDTPTGDNKVYAGVMNDRGDFMTGLGSIRNLAINAGHGTATSWSTATAQGGSQRIAQAGASTASLSSVSSSASTVSLLAAQTRRATAHFYNDSTEILYLAFAGTASTSAYTKQIHPGEFWSLPMPVYTGAISGIWAAANGSCKITELT